MLSTSEVKYLLSYLLFTCIYSFLLVCFFRVETGVNLSYNNLDICGSGMIAYYLPNIYVFFADNMGINQITDVLWFF